MYTRIKNNTYKQYNKPSIIIIIHDPWLLDSEHRFAKGKHHSVEELTATVPRAERGRGGRVAAAECVLLRRNPIREV